MDEREMLTGLDGSLLAEAFPSKYRPSSAKGSEAVAHLLAPRQWTERFLVRVEDETVSIPTRLHFASEDIPLPPSDSAWRFARALQSRSNDGFQRQRAARDLMDSLEPWYAPFIVALLGEYVVQILDDIDTALTPEKIETLGQFIAQNEVFWQTTKRRVTSYWNVYYRSESGSALRPKWAKDSLARFTRDEYVGFSITERLEAAAFGKRKTARV